MKNLSVAKGISFPFRIGVTGGVAMSQVTSQDFSHIDESIKQILLTNKFERTMLKDFYSEIDTALFEPKDTSARTLLEYEIMEALEKLEPRIEVVSIDFGEPTGFDYRGSSNAVYVDITYKILNFETEHILKMKVGEENVL